MGGLLAQSGNRIVQENDAADLVLINTCAFITPAKEESIEEILLAAEEKKDRPTLRLVVAGCLAQRHGRELFSHMPEVDLFVGTGEVGNIISHINKLYQESFQRQVILSKPNFLMTCAMPRLLPSQTATAYLKISEGCSNRCSYCVIPSVRGAARSRPPEDIFQEAETLARRGVKEIILIAQDTTQYGRDLKGRPPLSGLLRTLADIQGIEWIRLLYAHPARITRDLLETIAAGRKFCRYLDLPIQHIDDDVLKAMNRHIGGAKIRNIIAQIRQMIPDVALRTSLIVGFPKETPTRFNRLLDFVRETQFDHLGVFVYSKEEGTPAATFKSQISEKEKERRRDMIMSEQAAISAAINAALIGSVQDVLIEEKSDRKDYDAIGRMRRQAPDIDGVTYVKGENLKPGSLVLCEITAANEYDVFANALSSG